MFQGFSPKASDWFWELIFNNERPWFVAHKEEYIRLLKEPFQALAEDTLAEMRRRYPEREFTLHISRIYRDARRLFGRGPYKDHLWFSIKEEQARHIFDALRAFDHTDVPAIWAQCPDTQGIGLAIANRLGKAAGFHIIVL